MCNRSVLRTQKRSGYTRWKASFPRCDSGLLVVLECVIEMFAEQPKTARIYTLESKLSTCASEPRGCLQNTKTTRKWMSVSFASDIRFLVSGVFEEL